MLLSLFKSEINTEFSNILKWWGDHMIDDVHGGFLGRIDGYNRPHPQADKGIILNTRILWTYSKVYLKTREDQYRKMADRAYTYICDYFWDDRWGGVYWSVDFQGNVVNRQKQIYGQAFAIYSLCAYLEINRDPSVLAKIETIFNLVESHSLDPKNEGYFNVFNQDWTLATSQKLSDKDADQVKIMNTHLHILEAYTSLYRVYPGEKTYRALRYILNLYLDKFFNRDPCHVHLFFNTKWHPTSEEKSFGHDIESSWLITEAADVLKDAALRAKGREISLRLADITLRFGTDAEGGIFEKTDHKGVEIIKEKHWWPQAEGVVGFLNAWELSGEEKFLIQSIKTWHFIQNHFIDLENGEWHWLIDQEGKVDRSQDKAGPWKAPYHNVRMCLEVCDRLDSCTEP